MAAGCQAAGQDSQDSQLQALEQKLAAQAGQIAQLARELAAQRALVEEQRAALARLTPPASTAPEAPQVAATAPQELDEQRATGAQVAAAPAQPAQPAPRPAQPVGRTPPRRDRPPEVPPLFEQPGVLTAPDKYVVEPALQFGYASSNRVALVGYTVIPALLIGLIDVREVKRNTVTGSLSLRTGLSKRLEVEAKLPYVYRSDATVSRELFTGTAVERVFDTSGKHVGDIELAARYQLNQGGAARAYYIGGLRFKSRTGRDPFDVVTDCTTRCVGENVTGTGLPLELPTGSGFYSLQPSLTWLFPSDPAIFFGSVSYLYNFERKNVSRTVLNGERERIGDLKAGAVAGFNFGMGIALNDKTSISFGYDHSSVARMQQNGAPVPSSVRTQLGTLVIGYSYRLDATRTLNASVGVGVTRDTPDVSLTLRMPWSL
ncbi:acetate kinase [Massilia sp. PAMC28688]|nr:acetate kinase [Massilia sp. PAMC28688]